MRHDELIADAVEARGGSLIKSMGEGRLDRLGLPLGPRPRSRPRSPPTGADHRGMAAGRPHRRALGHPHRRGRAPRRRLLRPERQPRRARARAGPRGEILLSSVTGELVAAHLPEGCSLVDLGPHRLKGLGAPERIHALAGPGVSTPPSAGECPYRGLLAFEPDDRAFFFGREGSRRRSSGGSRPAGCWPSSAHRAAASPPFCAPASSPPCAPARSTGCGVLAPDAGTRACARRRRRAGSTRRRRPVRGAVHAV